MKNEFKKFESQFEEAVQTLIVLTGGSGSSAGKAGKEVLWTASQTIIAYIDCDTNQLVEAEGRLEWLAEDSQRSGWIYNLKGKNNYLVKVKKRKPGRKEDYQELIENGAITEPPTFEHYFQLLEVTEREINNSRLEEVLKKYETPVFVVDQQLGEFEYNKELHFFEGYIDWLGCETSVYLDESTAEKEGHTADDALKTLHCLVERVEDWDKKLRKFAAKKLVELANDWLQDSDEEEPESITEEDFAKRIEISELAIHENGEFEAYYYDDDMFWGHIIIIDGNIDGELADAYIAG